MTEPLHAPAYTATALAQREQFIRSAAEAWRRAGDARTAERLSGAADGLAERLSGLRPGTTTEPGGSRQKDGARESARPRQKGTTTDVRSY